MKLDSSTNLIGFNNGVYDLNEMRFKDGLPTDYVSKTVGYSFKDYTENDPIFDDINILFSKIQPDNDMRQYLCTYMAKILKGRDNKINIWYGPDNNTFIVMDLMKQLLGDYYCTLPETVIARKISSISIPELVDKYGKRLLVIQNAENKCNIYINSIKEIINCNSIIVKPLYGSPYNFVPQFNMIYACNCLPHIPSNDYSIYEKLSVMSFESKIDDSITKDFVDLLQPLMWLIITKYYPIFEKGFNGKYKIMEPDKIKRFTTIKKICVYSEFMEKNIIRTNDDNDTETITEIYKIFKQLYSSCYSVRPPTRKYFSEYLIKNNYKINEDKIPGVKLSNY